ncbi:MAG: biotin transporter BioY [Lachnospiraceae bacterium]|nr:biotin transporter BioY [Lachnospiraceae bacterium]
MSASVSTRIKTLDMVYVAMCAVMIAVCSWISIPMLVPVTLQTFGVFLTVGVLGGKRGSLAVLTYLLLGTVGIPVFSGFTGGIGSLLGSTGGYIIGFLFAALVMWGMEQFLGKKRWVLILSMVLGLLVCYVFGTIWFIVVYTNNTGEVAVWTALGWCVFPYIIPDILKIVVALTVCKKLAKVISI